MGKRPPRNPEEIYPQLVEGLQQALGPDLLGVAVFGSAAGGRYEKDLSDINLMILVADGAGHLVGRLGPWLDSWRGAAVGLPVVVTPRYLASSRDVFPLELTVMAAEHKCIHGQDPLEGITVEPADLRLQLERELKAKLMALRSRLMAAAGKKAELTALAQEALPALTALFKGYLLLATGGFPNPPSQVMDAMRAAGVKLEAMGRLEPVSAGRAKPSAGELAGMLEAAIAELSELSAQVDAMETGSGAA